MEAASFFSGDFSNQSLVALVVTALCCIFALVVVQLKSSKSLESGRGGGGGCGLKKTCDCEGSDLVLTSAATEEPYLNRGGSDRSLGEMLDRGPVVAVAAERQTGASMMEQLVPEITTHALSYLDYPSLCRLSMTNSLMRRAANDDNAWKALYHKDFTMEQDNITPPNGWKAYYAATRAVVNVNSDFFAIIRERSVQDMGRLWLNADYVKCVHASGELFTGYNAVMGSWQLAFNWEQSVEFQVREVRARVLTDMAWVTMKTYVDLDSGPFNVTNVFEFHNGQWYMVHNHTSVMLNDGEDGAVVQG